MALNITEVNAVNRLYDWLTGRDRAGRPVSREAAIESMATLAKSAHNATLCTPASATPKSAQSATAGPRSRSAPDCLGATIGALAAGAVR